LADRHYLFFQEGPRADGQKYRHIKILIEKDGAITEGESHPPERPEEEDCFFFPTEDEKYK